MKIGFIGLGSMGSAMAKTLLAAGHQLTVFNRTRSAASELAQAGAQVADTPVKAAREAEVVITMLANDRAVTDLTEGDAGLAAGLAADAVHLSMSTISPDLAKQLTQLHAAAGQHYLAVPVFGRPDAAAKGKLWAIAAGDTAQIERYRAILETMCRGVSIVGTEPWMANLVKITGNFTLAAMMETLGESFALLQKSGVEPATFLQIINQGVFQSPVYENYGTQIVEQRFDPALFALKLGLKDIRLVLQAADSAEVPMPLVSLIHDRLLSAVARGYADRDWSGLAKVSSEDAGI